MVMHARKSHRINDGYFEKHQTHPYQNSKYNSSKGNYSDRYSNERLRDSPNGNSYRGDSPDSQSPRDRDRDRNYSSKHNSSYSKERENNRLREKYSSDCVNRSPKDHQRRRELDQHHSRINHDRDSENVILHPKLISSSQNSRERDRDIQRTNKSVNSSMCSDKQRGGEERVTRIGDWSEHISSSGKKYYYNCKTEVSQWEKPREWIIRFQQQAHHSLYNSNVPKQNSNAVHSHDINKQHHHTTPSISSSSQLLPSRNNSGEMMKNTNHQTRPMLDSTPSSSLRCSYWNNVTEHHLDHKTNSGNSTSEKTEEMDTTTCTPNSTPTSSEVYNNHVGVGGGGIGETGSITSRLAALTQNKASLVLESQQLPTSSVSTLVTTTTNSLVSIPCVTPSVAASASVTSNIVPPPVTSTFSCVVTNKITTSNTNCSSLSASGLSSCPNSSNVNLNSISTDNLLPLKIDTSLSNNAPCDPGPPTPTHSENTAPSAPPTPVTVATLAAAAITTQSNVGGTTASVQQPHQSIDLSRSKQNSSPSANATNSSLSSLTSSVIHAMRPQVPATNPALANHYREDLTSHVRGWPADVCEKQAQKMSEESNHNSMHLARASAELKSARAIVRNSEIQATIQEQRILFLRQQIQRLEEMKSQNSYMSASDENAPNIVSRSATLAALTSSTSTPVAAASPTLVTSAPSTPLVASGVVGGAVPIGGVTSGPTTTMPPITKK